MEDGGGSSGVVLWRMGGFLWCCPMEDGGVPLVLSYGGWGGGSSGVVLWGNISPHVVYIQSCGRTSVSTPDTSHFQQETSETRGKYCNCRPEAFAGFHTGFFVGEGEKDHARLLMSTLNKIINT